MSASLVWSFLFITITHHPPLIPSTGSPSAKYKLQDSSFERLFSKYQPTTTKMKTTMITLLAALASTVSTYLATCLLYRLDTLLTITNHDRPLPVPPFAVRMLRMLIHRTPSASPSGALPSLAARTSTSPVPPRRSTSNWSRSTPTTTPIWPT